MGQGQGSISNNQKKETGGGGGGLVNGLRNGLTVVAGFGELGGANPLIHATDIDLGGFFFRLIDNAGSGLSAVFSPGANQIQLESGGPATLLLDGGNGLVQIGDLPNAGNGNLLVLNDTVQFLRYTDIGSNRFLNVDIANGLYQVGDISNAANNTFLSIADTTQQFQMSSNGSLYLSLNIAGGIYGVGDINNSANNTQLSIADNTRTVAVISQTGQLLSLDKGNNRYQIGDVNAVVNGTKVDVNDGVATQQVRIAALNGLRITGDTTLLHTGTALANGAGALLGTLATSPVAGNPTKWIGIDDNGTTRFIPAW